MNSISCKNCDGTMEITNKPKYNQGLGFFFIILGIVSIFLIFGAPFGILLLGIGIYMCSVKENVWYCGSCKTVVSRYEI